MAQSMFYCYRITFTYSGIRARTWPLTSNNQHSFLLCIISKATWRTKRVFTTEFQWLVFGTVASICSNIGTFFFPPQNSLVKGNMLHIEFDTYAHTVANIYTQTITKTSDTEAAINPQSPPIVIWCELLNLINHQTLHWLIQSFH